MAEQNRFAIGDVQLWADRHELYVGGQGQRLPPRLVHLLLRLASTPGETVTREQLLAAAWQRRVVNDEVLSRSIADLRQALGDDPREPRYIVTIPKLGYRLIAPVSPLSTEIGEPAAVAEPVAIAEPSPGPPGVPERSRWRGNWALFAAGLAALLALIWGVLPVGTERDSGFGAESLLRAQPLTSNDGQEISPRLSADGQQVAYAESTVTGMRIVLRALAGDRSRALTDGRHWDRCPSWYRDSIVFVRRSEGECQLMRQALDHDHPIALTTCAALPSCPSIDADRVLFTTPDGNGVASFDLRTSEIAILTTPPDGGSYDADPRRIHGTLYFARGGDDVRALYRLVGGQAEAVPGWPESMLFGFAAWQSPALLVASDAPGFRALASFDPTTGDLRLLGARGARYPDVVGQTLVYELAQYDANLWLYAPGQAPRRLTASTRYDAYPQLTPDDRAVVYQSNRDGTDALYHLDLESGAEWRLPAPEGERWAHPAFIDAKTLLLTRYRGADTDIVRYALGAAAAEELPLPAGAHDARADASGRIYYLFVSVDDQRLYRVDGDAAVEIGGGRVDQYALGPDGVYLRKGATIERCNPDCATLDLKLDPTWQPHWTVVGPALYAALDGDRTLSRWRDNEATPTDWPVPNTLARGVTVASDGSFAVIARTDSLAVDLYWASLAPD